MAELNRLNQVCEALTDTGFLAALRIGTPISEAACWDLESRAGVTPASVFLQGRQQESCSDTTADEFDFRCVSH